MSDEYKSQIQRMKSLVRNTEQVVRSCKHNYVHLYFLEILASLLADAPDLVNTDEQLCTFIERLPKDAAGVILRPGMKLWDALFFEVDIESIVWGNYHEHPSHNGQECCDLVNHLDGTSIIAFSKQGDRFAWWRCYSERDAAVRAGEALEAKLDAMRKGGDQ